MDITIGRRHDPSIDCPNMSARAFFPGARLWRAACYQEHNALVNCVDCMSAEMIDPGHALISTNSRRARAPPDRLHMQ